MEKIDDISQKIEIQLNKIHSEKKEYRQKISFIDNRIKKIEEKFEIK